MAESNIKINLRILASVGNGDEVELGTAEAFMPFLLTGQDSTDSQASVTITELTPDALTQALKRALTDIEPI